MCDISCPSSGVPWLRTMLVRCGKSQNGVRAQNGEM
jgi:hypothetical protein